MIEGESKNLNLLSNVFSILSSYYKGFHLIKLDFHTVHVVIIFRLNYQIFLVNYQSNFILF